MNPKSVYLIHNQESILCYSDDCANPVMIEFVGHWQVRGFPIGCLNQYTLEPNPESNGDTDTDTPPDQLKLTGVARPQDQNIVTNTAIVASTTIP